MALSTMKGAASRLFAGATKLFSVEIESPKLRIPLGTKVANTVLCVSVYMISSRLPLYGIYANRTLMDLGIGPIATASMAIQLLVGGKIICIKEKDSINKLQKMAGVCFTVVLAILNIVGGVYGPIGMISSLLVILQLVLAVMMLIYMDEFLEKGYGVGQSAISVFTACSVCEDVIWHAFSPITANFRGVDEFEGSVVELVRGLISSFNVRTVRHSFFRYYLPNLSTLI
ncbi:hypothetical protein SELMODRAFT_419976 [Selaginella moellendorffii]|uniref:Translocon Sec61/SecY plug domain-containing protein n=1 Tax=Selaginella moellendorffii TaxID=88036 RepID=D8SA61_SELML|nr:hypothetical protein SELMODRAFT_419976 [Selaginella moellendorffii]